MAALVAVRDGILVIRCSVNIAIECLIIGSDGQHGCFIS